MATKKTTESSKTTKATTEESKTKRSYVRKKPLTAVYVEFAGKQLSQDDLVAEAKSVMTSLGKDTEGIKRFEFYVQPTNGAIFFTTDGVGSEDYKIVIG